MSKTPRILDIEKKIHENKVKTDFISAPFTQIKNEQGEPRKIPDLANNLKASFGVERIGVSLIKLVDNEFGPNGEPVYAPSNGDDRIRFVGFVRQNSDDFGGRIVIEGIGDFIEITFYGTGLNILYVGGLTSDDIRVSVDGGAEGGDIVPDQSTIFVSRNYKTNVVIPVVSNLSLGVHTVKLRHVSGNATFYGFEIINESAQLTVNPGKPFVGGPEAELDTQQLFNTKPSSLTGTKGGRVLTYLNEDGTVGQVVTAVDDTLGPELLTNGTFDTDLTGWTDASTGGSTAAWSADNGGSLLLTNSGVGGENPAITQDIPTVIGESYEISIAAPVGGTAVGQQIEFRLDSQTIILPANSGETKKIVFVATASTSTMRITTGSSLVAGTSYADVASVKVAPAKFLGFTDHSNEEIVRRVNFREFGANRADDFSTLAGTASNRAFTLDDGTTTLVCNNCFSQNNRITLNNATSFVTITFVGTGLDIARLGGTVICGNVTIDGNVVGTWAQGDTKICSGLPYGTHTVKIDNSIYGLGFDLFEELIIYQPKKPTLPDTAVQEIADYNLMADFVQTFNTTPASQGIDVSQGVLRKMPTREWTFGGGSWGLVLTTPITDPSGFAFTDSTDGAYVEYTFFGTGFDFRLNPEDGHEILFQLDGSSDFSSLDTNFLGNGTATWTPATGRIVGNDIPNCSLAVKNLPLGIHTIKAILINRVSGGFFPNCIDIITPIHINSPDLKTGSLALLDKRRETDIEGESKGKVDWTRAKLVLEFDMNTNEILYSKNVSSLINLGSIGNYKVFFKQPFKDDKYVLAGLNENDWQLSYVDSPSDKTKNSLNIVSRNNSSVQQPGRISLIIFGELESEEDVNLEDL